MGAVLFGSISTLADTSELQRDAFNRAFREHGLDWTWERDDYRARLGSNGGAARVADYASERGETVDAAAVHATKSRLFQESLRAGGVQPRPGVVETAQAAKAQGLRLGLVTTTSRENIDALFAGLGGALSFGDFDVVVDASGVEDPKPDPAAYAFALASIDEQPGACVAIEDNVGGVASAKAAGLATVAFPNENTAGADFGAADQVVEQLDADTVLGLVTASA